MFSLEPGRVYASNRLSEFGLLTVSAPHRKGHYGRALEEAILSHRSQWPKSWNHVNPISGGRSFNSMSGVERVSFHPGPCPRNAC